MSDAANASASAAPAKVAKKKTVGAKKAKTSDHPPYASMVQDAIKALKERGGSSRQAILKYILQHNKLDQNERLINAHLKVALNSGVKKGVLLQSKGVGASGSFKIGEVPKEVKAKKPKAKADAKPKAKKPKSASPPKKAAKPKTKKATGEPKAKKPKAVKPKSPAKKLKAAAKPKVKKPVPAKVAKPKKAAAAKPKKAAAAKPKKAAAKK